jgi:EmrB/QacA subfamily drug resistance transporter
MTSRSRMGWTLAITSLALFMTTLDNLVVTTALPTVQRDLHASISGLEWTVNAYTLTFAVLLMTGAALGDRYGRRRMFVIGLAVFTAGSAAAALSPSIDALIAARALQGVGGAIVMPLTLTLLSDAFPVEKRGLALGVWGGISGLGVALGPVIGGMIVQGLAWQWIFWLNVPVGLVTIVLGRRLLVESYGPSSRLDVPGVTLITAGMFGIVWGLVRGNSHGWTSPEIVGSLAAGALLTLAFVRWELRTREPMLPMPLFRSRGFSAANLASLLMFFGMFGSIFLLTQYLQNVQGYSPLQAGLHILPWTGMPMIVAPIAGALSDRIGGKPLIATGLALQAAALAWMAAVIRPDVPYVDLVGPFVIAGAGMALFFAPVAAVVLGAVGRSQAGQASGANNAIRELGGVFGVAVLASIFSHQGGYQTPEAFTSGITPALWVGAAVVALGTGAALMLPGRRTAAADAAGSLVGEPT